MRIFAYFRGQPAAEAAKAKLQSQGLRTELYPLPDGGEAGELNLGVSLGASIGGTLGLMAGSWLLPLFGPWGDSTTTTLAGAGLGSFVGGLLSTEPQLHLVVTELPPGQSQAAVVEELKGAGALQVVEES